MIKGEEIIMKAYRLPKGVTEHYTSFEELRSAYGLKPVTKQTRDKEKLERQREFFCSKNLCSACKKPMVWIDGSVMVCKNPDCAGIKYEYTDSETGEVKVRYSPSYKFLSEENAEKAQSIFAEYEE